MSKHEQLRQAILQLVDNVKQQRAIDLLNALECEVGHAALRRAAQIVGTQADDAFLAYYPASHGYMASIALRTAETAIRLTDWEV